MRPVRPEGRDASRRLGPGVVPCHARSRSARPRGRLSRPGARHVARGAPRTLEDLAAHDTVAYSRGGRTNRWSFPDADGRIREIPTQSRIRFDDLEAIADAAVAGLGLAWLPCWLIVDRVRRGELVRVLAEIPGLVFDLHAIWPQAPHLPLRVRTAIDALAARLPERMGV